MKFKYISRSMLAAVFFTAIPFASVSGVVSPAPPVNDQSVRMGHLQTRGSAEITRRISNLGDALTKLNATSKLSATDKAALVGQVNLELTALANLKTKLVSDTDLASARVDVASIVGDYRVYVLMLPKTRMIASSDQTSIVEDKLGAINATLQAKLDTMKTAGKDTTVMQASLDDLKSKTADATTKTTGMSAQLLVLTPAQYDANHALLQPFHQSLEAAQVDLKAARDDASSVAASLGATH
jgi:hypothetical protein